MDDRVVRNNKWWYNRIRGNNWFSFNYWWFNWLVFIACIFLFWWFYPSAKPENNISCDNSNLNQQLNDISSIIDSCCDCKSIESMNNDTIIDNQIVKKPNENCRAFFSGRLVTDDIKYKESVIFEPNHESEYVGAGNYPRASKAFPNSSRTTFDGIAIVRNTRVIIYSRENFQGDVLLDVEGPALINNIRWKGSGIGEIIEEINSKELCGNLNQIFPKNCRKYSKSDMHTWSNGSLKVLCNQ